MLAAISGVERQFKCLFQVRLVFCKWLPWLLSMSHPDPCPSVPSFLNDSSTCPLSVTQQAVKHDDRYLPAVSCSPEVEIDASSEYLGITRHLAAIFQQLQFMTSKILTDEKQTKESTEWKFAASVLDRLCFWMLLIFHVILSVVIFTLPASREHVEDVIEDF